MIEGNYFGSPADSHAVRTAKLLAFRYCVFADRLGGGDYSGWARGVVAQDFVVRVRTNAAGRRGASSPPAR